MTNVEATTLLLSNSAKHPRQIEDMVVVDNVSEHMLGNVYCK